MDAALPLPPLPVTADTRRVDPPILGFIIGAAIPALVASAAWWLRVEVVAVVATIGVPIGAVIGAVMSWRLVGPTWVATSVASALAAPLVLALPIALVMAAIGIGSVLTTGLEGLVVVPFAIVVIAYAEVIGAPITLPVAFIVALLVRRAASMSSDRAMAHVGLLVLVTIVVAAMTLAANAGLLVPYGIGPVDPGY